MWIINIIKSWFCKHEYEFIRNIHGDEINWCGGYRSIWICKKCGNIQYRNELELSLIEKLQKNYKQYYENKYNNWCELHKDTLSNIINTMIDQSNLGYCWAEFILICNEKSCDKNYYIKWFENHKLHVDCTIYQQHEHDICNEINQYKFTINWDKN